MKSQLSTNLTEFLLLDIGNTIPEAFHSQNPAPFSLYSLKVTFWPASAQFKCYTTNYTKSANLSVLYN